MFKKGNPDPCKVYCQLETVDPGSKTTPINSTANASDYSPCAPEPSPHTAVNHTIITFIYSILFFIFI